MRDVVLDASVLAHWFGPLAQRAAPRLRSEFEAGRLTVIVARPPDRPAR